MQHGLIRGIAERDIAELDAAFDAFQAQGAARVFVFGRFVEHLAGALQAGQGFAELGSDADDLEERRGEVSEKHDVGEIAAEGELSGQDLARAHEHDDGPDDAHQHGRGEAHERGGGEGAEDVLQQALDAGGEDLVLARLGVVALDHAHAAQRFGEASGDLGVDAAALAEDGADGAEGLLQAQSEDQQEAEGDGGHDRADADQHGEGDDGGEQSADEVDEAGADEVAHALDVGHDARDQRADLGGVEVLQRQAADVLLHAVAEFGDEALGGLGERLREGEGCGTLHDGGRAARLRPEASAGRRDACR